MFPGVRQAIRSDCDATIVLQACPSGRGLRLVLMVQQDGSRFLSRDAKEQYVIPSHELEDMTVERLDDLISAAMNRLKDKKVRVKEPA